MKADRWTAELRDQLDASARGAGFATAGVARVPDADEPQTAADAERFAAWVAAGRAGEMGYLERRDEHGELVRGALHRTMPWARSVVVCAWNYNAQGPRSVDGAEKGTGWIARYAWMGSRKAEDASGAADYHEVLLMRLRQVECVLLEGAECTTLCYVDTGPILERDVAARAGVGWIGKNTCVLNQGLGSWLLLGVIVTSLPMEERHVELLAHDRCGTCTRCVDACPTGALLAGKEPGNMREMDASRCISYLTIEKKGVIDESLREGMGRNVFGCDICQEVCPWNRRAPIAATELVQPRAELMNPSLEWLAAMDAAAFKRRFRDSPLERTGRKRLHRNVAIAMGNSGDARYLAQLDAWTETAGDTRADEGLREAAEWARRRIGGAGKPEATESASASLVGDVDRPFQSSTR